MMVILAWYSAFSDHATTLMAVKVVFGSSTGFNGSSIDFVTTEISSFECCLCRHGFALIATIGLRCFFAEAEIKVAALPQPCGSPGFTAARSARGNSAGFSGSCIEVLLMPPWVCIRRDLRFALFASQMEK